MRSHKYMHTSSESNKLIDLNEINTLVAQQLHQDAKDFQITKINPLVNVILQKKQPQLDLITFHHGACFAPITSTWIKAIQNGHFAT